MRILLVNESARSHTGGLHRHVVDSAGWLQRCGHEVGLVYTDGGAVEVDVRTFPVRLDVTLPELREQMLQVILNLRPEVVQVHLAHHRYFIEELPNLVPTCRFVHDQSWYCSGGDRMSGRFTPCHRPHGLACLAWHYLKRCGGKNPAGNLRRWLQVSAYESLKQEAACRIQVASEFMRRGLLEDGYLPDRVDVVPLFAAAPAQPNNTESGLLLVACRLVRAKGVHLLLGSLAELGDLTWRLVIAGDGPERARLPLQAARLGLGERVEFLGELGASQLAEWYARCSLVLSPVLRPEPFGMIGIEAMAHGKPVVAFDGGGTEEWLRDGQTGIVVRERSASAYARALRRLLRDISLAQRLGNQARVGWAQYRPEAFVARLVDSFATCCRDFEQGKRSTCRQASARTAASGASAEG